MGVRGGASRSRRSEQASYGSDSRHWYSLGKHSLLAAFRFEEEDAGAGPLLLAFADFAFAVKVPDGLDQCFHDVGSLFSECVVQVMCGDDVGFPALLGAGETEQAYDVAVVCVEILSLVDISSVS